MQVKSALTKQVRFQKKLHLEWLKLVIVFVWLKEKGRQQDKGPFGTRIKIMCEEQLVDPQMDYITSVNVPQSSVFN